LEAYSDLRKDAVFDGKVIINLQQGERLIGMKSANLKSTNNSGYNKAYHYDL
jgi:hypothetical protein